MPLTALLEKLYARRRFGIRPGVDRVSSLLATLGNPEKQFRSIHVVGTNGKGSTSAFLSSVLKCAGHRTAQFSSPHLVRFSERFRIDGIECPTDKLASNLEAVLDAAPEEATFFEITTALAALLFSGENIELAVIEAGMGGRSDATAAICGEMTIITPIAIDHSEYLGETLQEIAYEKAGIVEPFTKIVSAEQHDAVREVIKKKSRAANSPLTLMGADFSANWNQHGTLDYHGISRSLIGLVPGIPGRYQAQNAALALAAAEMLDSTGTVVDSDSLARGVTGVYWPGRMELIPGNPPMLLDGAHNPAGSVALAEALLDYPCKRLLLVTGVCSDKDIEQMYAPLIPLVDLIFTVTPSIDRALDAEELSRLFSAKGVVSWPCDTVVKGIQKARSESGAGDMILVCGSLFIVGETKAWLEETDYSGIRG
ncbi:MAG: folylpolyglutamate synthase/dihydrofolate synthase family protein [Deltaproteobacteria bacterium]